MTEISTRCTECESRVDEDDLFCANCGREVPHADEARLETLTLQAINFACRGCGASMNYDAGAGSLRCPFCGSAQLEKEDGHRVVRPDRVVPFAVERREVEPLFRRWCGRGFWRPGDLGSQARLTEITAVYIPFWVFGADADCYWTADSSETPFGARGDWMPLFGEHRERVEGVLVTASGGLTLAELDDVAPFDLHRGVPPEDVDLESVTVERFALGRKYARRRARGGMEEHLRERCRGYVPGRARNVQVNVSYSRLAGRPVLLPFWILAYRYRDRVYRFVANGSTGKSTGSAPVSWAKLVAVILVVLVTLAVAGVVLL